MILAMIMKERDCLLCIIIKYINIQFQPPHGKTNKMTCAQQRLSSAWASTQSNQSLLCTQWVAKNPSFLHADSEDTVINPGRCPG